jgi:hypothetical protein
MTETSTNSLPKTWKLSAAERRQLLSEMALGERNYRQLAAKFGISRQYVKQLAVSNREEIEEIKKEVLEREKEIWPADRFERNHNRVTRLAEIAEEMRLCRAERDEFGEIVEAALPTGSQWLALVQEEQKIIRAIQEDYGQLPTRVPAHRLGLLQSATSSAEMMPSTLAVYPEWNPDRHLIDPFEIPTDWPRWWSVDFGFDHPFSWGNFAQARNGTVYLTQEIHRTRTIEEDHADEIVRLTRGQHAPEAMVCDHDPSGQATLVRHLTALVPGLSEHLRVVSAYKDVGEGLKVVRARLRTDKFKVFRDAVKNPDQLLLDRGYPIGAAEEFPRYVWDGDVPLKEWDDAMDKIRYLFAQLDLKGG